MWYGYEDPVRGGDEIRELDPTKEAKREVVRQWAKAFGERTVTARDLQGHWEVRAAIASAKAIPEREVTTMMVGKYLGTFDGVRLDLDWVVQAGKRSRGHAQEWRLEHVDAPEP